MIYLFPVMIHGGVKKPQREPNKYVLFFFMEVEGEGWDPLKLA